MKTIGTSLHLSSLSQLPEDSMFIYDDKAFTLLKLSKNIITISADYILIGVHKISNSQITYLAILLKYHKF